VQDRSHTLRRWGGRGWLAYLLAGAVAAGIFLDLEPGSAAQRIWYDAIGASAVVAILVGIWLFRPAAAWTWGLMAAGQASFVIGDILWEYYAAIGEEPFPSVADAFYLAGYPLLAIGLSAGIRRRMGGGDRSGLLDAAILTTGLFVLAWVFVIAPLAAVSDPDPLGFTVSLAYPIGDLLLIGVAMGLATSPGARVPSFWLICASLGCLLLADQLYVFENLAGTYVDGGLLDVVWIAAYVLWGAAALHPSMVEVNEPHPVAVTLLGPIRLTFLGAAMLVGPALLTLGRGDVGPQLLVVAVATALLSLLVLVRLAGLVGALARDVERRRALEDQLTFQAFHDPLTGLANRRRFVDAVVDAMAARTTLGTVTVMFVDLDDFKTVNDSLGHAAGDELLRRAAERIRDAVRSRDLVGRLGGDEFGVLLEGGSDVARARGVAERLLASLRSPLTVGGTQVRVSASIGMSVDGPSTDSADDLLREADIAMYRAKAGGKDRVLLFGPVVGSPQPTATTTAPTASTTAPTASPIKSPATMEPSSA
jgi:diguanylate cyclase (GGDEF)-like protein